MSQTPDQPRRCVVVVNPIKVSADFHRLVTEHAAAAGWAEPEWLETSVDDPGRGVTARALATSPDLVIGAGGDGTIRVVAGAMARSGVPMGVVPAGTANLLARNLDLPLAEAGALTVAFGGRTRDIDLITLSADGGEPDYFAVIAGVGVDAMIMDEVDPNLKKKMGPAAYFVAAGKALGRLPIPMRITVDGGRRHRRRAMAGLIGNVGKLTGGIDLIPGAEPDSGRLSVYVAAPHTPLHWVKLVLRVLTRRRRRGDPVDLWYGRRVEIHLGEEEAYEMDGDVAGQCRTLVAEIQPGVLTVCVP